MWVWLVSSNYGEQWQRFSECWCVSTEAGSCYEHEPFKTVSYIRVGRDFRFSNVIMATFSVFRIPKGFVWGFIIFIATSWRFPEQDHAILCQGKRKLIPNNDVRELRAVVLKIFGLETQLNFRIMETLRSFLKCDSSSLISMCHKIQKQILKQKIISWSVSDIIECLLFPWACQCK